MSGASSAAMLSRSSAAAFTPASVSNIALWLRADMGTTLVSGRASVWADQSGLGRDFAQGTAGNRPTYNATGGPNSMPCFDFAGGNPDSMTSVFSMSQPMHFFWAGKGNNVGTDSCGIADNGTGSRNDIWDVGSVNRWLTLCGGSQQSVTATHNVNHMFEYSLNGASTIKRLDGANTSQSPGTNGFSGLALGRNALLGPATISLAELVIYSSTISGSDLTSLRNYFASRYGLTT